MARSRAEPEPLLNAAFAEDETADPLYDEAQDAAAFEEPADALANMDEAPVLDDLDPDATNDDEMDITSFLDGNEPGEADDAAPEITPETARPPLRKERAPETEVEAIREMAEDELELKRQDAATAHARGDLTDPAPSAEDLDPQLQDDIAAASGDDEGEDLPEVEEDETHKPDATTEAEPTASGVAAVLDSATAAYDDFDLLGDDTADADDQEVNIAAMLDGLSNSDVAKETDAVENSEEDALSDLDDLLDEDQLDEDLDDLALLDAPAAPDSAPATTTPVAIDQRKDETSDEDDSLDLSDYFDTLEEQEKAFDAPKKETEDNVSDQDLDDGWCLETGRNSLAASPSM